MREPNVFVTQYFLQRVDNYLFIWVTLNYFSLCLNKLLILNITKIHPIHQSSYFKIVLKQNVALNINILLASWILHQFIHWTLIHLVSSNSFKHITFASNSGLRCLIPNRLCATKVSGLTSSCVILELIRKCKPWYSNLKSTAELSYFRVLFCFHGSLLLE